MIKDRQGKNHSEKNGRYLPKDIGDSEQNSSGTTAEKEKLKKEHGIDLDKREKKSNLSNEEKRLQELTGEKVGHELTEEEKKRENKRKRKIAKINEKSKSLVKKIKSLKPIKIKLKGEDITVDFDTYCAKKNIYAKGSSDKAGWKWKQQSIDKFSKLITSAKYIKTSKEKGKNKKAHIGVKDWHYYRAIIKTRRRKYEAVINIRDKGNKKYVYEIKVKKIKKRLR